jgi:hypothetical protein
MVYNNKTDDDIHMVTSDNHSLNQLNFVTLDSIDVDYAQHKKCKERGRRFTLLPEGLRSNRTKTYGKGKLSSEKSISEPKVR